jgi:hypothetical protein
MIAATEVTRMTRAPMIVRFVLVVALLGLPYRPAAAADDPENLDG